MADNVRTVSFLLLLILPVSCGSGEKTPKPIPDPGPPPTAKELEKAQLAFFELMESNDHHNERLIDSIGKSDRAPILDRIRRMRENMVRARDLRIRETEQAEKELDEEFDLFLQDLDKARDGNWKTQGKELYNLIQDGCTRCHDRFEED